MSTDEKYRKYSYRVNWSEEDGEFIGLCTELPSLSWLAQSPEAALGGIRNVVAEVVADLVGNGEEVPEPISTRRFTGKFMVHVPPDVHRQLTMEAAEAGVSLNRLINAKLSQNGPAAGSGLGGKSPAEMPASPLSEEE